LGVFIVAIISIREARMAWSYTERVCARRQALLRNAPPYEDIVSAVRSEIDSVTACEKESRDRPGLWRVEIRLRVSKDTADLFFNSSPGYRGQFCDGPGEGMRANRTVISALEASLLEACEQITFNRIPEAHDADHRHRPLLRPRRHRPRRS
jgi:hypothetical protein